MNEQDKVERVSKMIAVAESKLESAAPSGLGDFMLALSPALKDRAV